MPKLAANLSLLFTEVPFVDRFERAAAAGFRRIEFQFPYAFDINALSGAARRNNLDVVLFNLPAGDFAAGDRGLAAHPAYVGAFRAGVDAAIGYARALGCRRVNCLAGRRDEALPIEAQRDTLAANLRFAAERLERHGIALVVEMLNPFDVPGYLLPTPSSLFALLDGLAIPNLKAQYDIYHAQRTEGELADTLSRRLADIGHVQLADTPGRHQPGTGEINIPFVLRHLDRIGYIGSVGLEYVPTGTTEESLAWVVEHGFDLG